MIRCRFSLNLRSQYVNNVSSLKFWDGLLEEFSITSDVVITGVRVSVAVVEPTEVTIVVQVWSVPGSLTVSVTGGRVVVVILVLEEVTVTVRVWSFDGSLVVSVIGGTVDVIVVAVDVIVVAICEVEVVVEIWSAAGSLVVSVVHVVPVVHRSSPDFSVWSIFVLVRSTYTVVEVVLGSIVTGGTPQISAGPDPSSHGLETLLPMIS